MNESIFTIVGVSVGFVIAVTFAFWQMLTVLLEVIKSKNARKLKDDIANALKNGEPTWEHIKAIESCYPLLSPNSLKRSLNNLIKQEVVNGVTEDSKSLTLLEGWASKLKSDEPFEGIPPELKLPLERIRQEAPEHQHMIELLVSQLQEYTDQAREEKKRNSIISIIGLLVGIGGFAIGAYQIYDSADSHLVSPQHGAVSTTEPNKLLKSDG
ncbi:hypothetical protein RFM71_004467 [Vibrio parahaemolyticus]|uniref:hypothetical protein n=1 Tax=Vibrio parahaemolyticus TaxID=670 RepID=UPI001EEAE8C4|nr:hypothetical protein [Vibrio parahaemolyticus]ELA3127210.1 hypothetical protein [Vibrio parahaemolyticus]MCG6435276.1 hypothetical protein [Vibrio parahaemolyticus]